MEQNHKTACHTAGAITPSERVAAANALERIRLRLEEASKPKRFVDKTLWPEFEELGDTLRGYLEEVTTRIVSTCVVKDSSEAEVFPDQPKGLPGV